MLALTGLAIANAFYSLRAGTPPHYRVVGIGFALVCVGVMGGVFGLLRWE